MSSDDDRDVMISVRGLGKAYTIAHAADKPTTLAEATLARLRRPLHRPARDTFWALKDVSFDVRRGDVVGVIGRNGAGKSTLFKVLSRITEPTTGQVDLYGRVGSLLEVGTGFSGELTGRENIYLNGSILGMRRAEIAKRFDEIVDFAGVEKFLDTPVKRYSSGMYVRLAFAVAANLNCDILILDEVLAVGDATFQTKCLGKVAQVARDGRTIMLVSHNMGVMKSTCTTAIELERGCLLNYGDVQSVSRQYERNATPVTRGSWTLPADAVVAVATITNVELHIRDGAGPVTYVKSSEAIDVRFTIDVRERTDLLKFGFDLLKDNILVFRTNQVESFEPLATFDAGIHTVVCHVPSHLLFSGTYQLAPHMSIHNVKWLLQSPENRLTFDVEFDAEQSPFLNLINPSNYTAPIFPRLCWSNTSH